MYQSDVAAMAQTAKKKVDFMNNNLLGFFIMSMVAGMYIGLGSIFFGVIGGYLSAAGSPFLRLVTGTIFSVGLCMVVVSGAELFTGNNLVMSVGGMKKTVAWSQIIKFWVICWIGNLVGSVLTGTIFTLTGIPAGEEVGTYLASVSAGKMAAAPVNLLAKAILCNICVCVAIWGCSRIKTDGAKFAMCFCCVATFVGCGFEHSIANMTYFTIGLQNPHGAAVTLAGMFYNLLFVTLGNMIGGICFVAVPYVIAAREKE